MTLTVEHDFPEENISEMEEIFSTINPQNRSGFCLFFFMMNFVKI